MEPHTNGSFRSANGGVWSTPEYHRVPCGCGYKISIKACPNREQKQWSGHTFTDMCPLDWFLSFSWV
jgi:hypothetical protein